MYRAEIFTLNPKLSDQSRIQTMFVHTIVYLLGPSLNPPIFQTRDFRQEDIQSWLQMEILT